MPKIEWTRTKMTMTGKQIKILSLLLFFILLSPSLWAQVKVEASLSPSDISLEDEATLTVTVTGSTKATEPTLPPQTALKIIPTGTSSSISIVNGDMSVQKSYTFSVVPLSQGTFTLGPVSVFLDGREYKSEPVTIKVGASAYSANQQQARPQPNDNVPSDNMDERRSVFPDTLDRDFWIDTLINKKEVYEHEQVIYTFRFYTRVNVGNATLNLPEFKDFRVEELVPEKKYYKDLDGARYVVSEKVYGLFPLKTGVINIGETTLRVEPLNNPLNQFFNDPFFGGGSGGPSLRPKTLRDKPNELTVKALPDPKPKNFMNIVGPHFTLSSTCSAQKVNYGDSFDLTLRVEGQGNVDEAILSLPEEITAGKKVYDGKPKQELVRGEHGLYGYKEQSWALVPTGSGTIEIPSFTLSYFNPENGQYEDLNTKPCTVEISGGPANNGSVITESVTPNTTTVPPGENNPFLQFPDDEVSVTVLLGHLMGLKNYLFVFPVLLFVLGLLIKLFSSRLNSGTGDKKVSSSKLVKAFQKMAENACQQKDKSLGEKASLVLAETRKTIEKILKLSSTNSVLTSDELELLKKSYPAKQATFDLLIVSMRQLEAFAYASVSTKNEEDLKNLVFNLIRQLEGLGGK